jgi:hypothetical protein
VRLFDWHDVIGHHASVSRGGDVEGFSCGGGDEVPGEPGGAEDWPGDFARRLAVERAAEGVRPQVNVAGSVANIEGLAVDFFGGLFRGASLCGETEVVTPKRPKKEASAYEKRKARNRFRRRAAIEPRVGHLKTDFRLGRNFLKGQLGDAINLLLTAAGSNLSLWMRQVLFTLYSEIRKLAENFGRLHRPLPA